VTDTEGNDDEVMAALLWATGHPDRLPDPPDTALKAQHGREALRARLAADGHRAMTRDERRLEGHYKAALAAWEAQVVEVYRNR
jgi:hypothetical protein